MAGENGWFEKYVQTEFANVKSDLGKLEERVEALREQISEFQATLREQRLRTTMWAAVAGAVPSLLTAIVLYFKMHGA